MKVDFLKMKITLKDQSVQQLRAERGTEESQKMAVKGDTRSKNHQLLSNVRKKVQDILTRFELYFYLCLNMINEFQ